MHWLYSIGSNKHCKRIGFTMSIRNDIETHIGFTVSTRKTIWFYGIGPNKCLKHIGFTVSVQHRVKIALGLQYPSKQVSEKQWFYSVRPNKC